MISSNLKNRIFTSIFLFLLLALALINNLIMTYCLIIFGVLSLMEFFNLTKKIFVKSFYYFFTNIIFSIYIFIFFFLFFFFSNIIQLKIILFAFLLGCIASDIGGFVFGKIFKGPKLSSISPKKTISGAIGSLFLTCAFLSLSVNYFINIFTYKIIIIAYTVNTCPNYSSFCFC